MAESSVSLHSRAMVLPAQPTTHSSAFFLSCFDIFWQDIHYNQRLLFYDGTLSGVTAGHEGSNGRAVMEKLKSSLALCLAHYYPWCGRLAKGAHPPHRLFLDCCDAGVEFVEASSPLPLSALARDGFQMNPLFLQLCQHPDHTGDCLFSSPLLSIQATLFSDGGLVLGIAHSHVVVDGQSLWDFMISWGECARGVPLTLPPLHNRQMLAVLHPSPEKATWSLKSQIKKEDMEEEGRDLDKGSFLAQNNGEHKISSAGIDATTSSMEVDHKLLTDKDKIVENKCSTEAKNSGVEVIIDNYSNAGMDVSANEDNASSVKTDQFNDSAAEITASSSVDKTEPLVQCMFDLPVSAIKKLKSEAGGGFTSFEVMCAHFWKHFAAARGTATSEPTLFFAPVSCRTRMTPSVPSSYFGNVIAFDVSLSTVGAIRRETLCATAYRIHDIVAAIKEDYIIGFMHWLETHDNRIVEVFSPSIFTCKGVNTASSPWFPAYQVDYGWGKPVAVRPARVHGDGELVLFGGHPGSKPGDLEICTALPESVLKRLLSDATFLPTRRCRPWATD